MGYRTSVDVQSATRDKLRAAKEGQESYDELLNRLLQEAGYDV